jgi:archaetidylinositol phosphate synthase
LAISHDLAADALVTIGVFIGIGWGLTYSNPDAEGWSLLMSLVTGVALATTFYLRHKIEQRLGKAVTRQPALSRKIHYIYYHSLFGWMI